MFVPVVTKDMQLFQNARQPPRLKNVRSRAQSLETNLNANGAPVAGSKSRVAPAASRGNASTSRNCQSVGALPTSAASCVSRSPPKTNSFRKPLDPIVEGVALRCGEKMSRCRAAKPPPAPSASAGARRKSGDSMENQENNSVSSAKRNGNTSANNKSTPDLNALKITERQMQMSAAGLSLATTSSSPGLWKASSTGSKCGKNIIPDKGPMPTNMVTPPLATSASDASSNHSGGGKSLVKWLTNTLKGKNSYKDHGATACAKCARLDGDHAEAHASCTCASSGTKTEEEMKSWRSIVPRRQVSAEEEDFPKRVAPVAAATAAEDVNEQATLRNIMDISETVSVRGS